MKIGIAGTGRMGAGIGVRLLDLGHDLTVWNRSAGKTSALVERGASLAATPADLVRRCEFVLTILTDARAIDAVYKGADGLLSGDVAGKLFIEMSTVQAETERGLARAVAAKGAVLVECPVGGMIPQAREGTLFGLVGGAERDVARARPLLEQLCRRIEHVGPVGAGAALKLALNLPVLVYWQSFGEALSLVQSLGLDPERLVSIFADSAGGPNMLRLMGPRIAAALKEDPPDDVFFNIDMVRKDLRTMLGEARSQGRRLPLAMKALEIYDEATRAGLGAKNCTALPVFWIERGREIGSVV